MKNDIPKQEFVLGMSYDKFAQTYGSKYGASPEHSKGECVRRRIKGTFKEVPSGEIIEGDNFECIVLGGSAEKSYRVAIDFFNHTRRPHEKERAFVSAEWDESSEEFYGIKDKSSIEEDELEEGLQR